MPDPLSGTRGIGSHNRLWSAGAGTQDVVVDLTDSGRIVYNAGRAGGLGLVGRARESLSPGGYAG